MAVTGNAVEIVISSLIDGHLFSVFYLQIDKKAKKEMERESRVPMKMGDFSLMDSEFNNIRGR